MQRYEEISLRKTAYAYFTKKKMFTKLINFNLNISTAKVLQLRSDANCQFLYWERQVQLKHHNKNPIKQKEKIIKKRLPKHIVEIAKTH